MACVEAVGVDGAGLSLTRGKSPEPVFGTEALALGVRAIYALPLRIGVVAIGAADLYRGGSPLDGGSLGDEVPDPLPLQSLEGADPPARRSVRRGALPRSAHHHAGRAVHLAGDVVRGHRRFEEVQ